MNEPTYKQIGDLYHELWKLQRKFEQADADRAAYEKELHAEEDYSYTLLSIINRAHEYLLRGDAEKALKVLKAP